MDKKNAYELLASHLSLRICGGCAWEIVGKEEPMWHIKKLAQALQVLGRMEAADALLKALYARDGAKAKQGVIRG